MKAERDIPLAPYKSSQGNIFLTSVLVALVALGLGVLFSPELRDYAKQEFYSALSFTGIKQPDEFADVYQKLGIAPLPAGLAASTKISSNLAGLAKEPCDKRAIFALQGALVTAREERIAANALSGFAANCPQSESETFLAAEIFLGLGDHEKVITLTNTLIRNNPSIANYYYLRGKAMAAAKRYQEALADYTSTIELYKNPRDLLERVFVEMANIYAAAGRPCEAARTIMTWVAMAPTERNTLSAKKMIQEYAAKGCTGTADFNKL
jgi:tetratricopeptide (TPR) repeat protein